MTSASVSDENVVALLEQRRLQLAVVLDDPVEDEVDVALQAPRQRVCVLGADAAVRRPARVPDAGRRQGLAVRRGVLQSLRLPTARISASFPFSTSARPAES